MKTKIHIKQVRFENRHVKNKYYIFLRATEIEEITYKKQNKIFILGYLYIYPEYQKQGYGKQIIDYILSHYKTNFIIEEILYESKQHKVQRRKITYCENCSNSFVIPKYEISDDELYNLLEIAYWIN